MMHTQRVTSEHTIWFFVLLIVSATWAIMSLMIAAMLSRFKAVSLAENLKRMEENEKVKNSTYRNHFRHGGPLWALTVASYM